MPTKGPKARTKAQKLRQARELALARQQEDKIYLATNTRAHISPEVSKRLYLHRK